jgi:hypothetical protein
MAGVTGEEMVDRMGGMTVEEMDEGMDEGTDGTERCHRHGRTRDEGMQLRGAIHQWRDEQSRARRRQRWRRTTRRLRWLR